jgi:hypothetical protein
LSGVAKGRSETIATICGADWLGGFSTGNWADANLQADGLAMRKEYALQHYPSDEILGETAEFFFRRCDC